MIKFTIKCDKCGRVVRDYYTVSHMPVKDYTGNITNAKHDFFVSYDICSDCMEGIVTQEMYENKAAYLASNASSGHAYCV